MQSGFSSQVSPRKKLINDTAKPVPGDFRQARDRSHPTPKETARL